MRIAAIKASPAAIQTTQRIQREFRLGSSGVSASASSIPMRASPIDCQRRRGSLRRQRSMTGRADAGTRSRSASSFNTAASVSATVSRSNGLRPVSIS